MGQGADTTAELDREFHGLEDRLDRRAIDALTGKGAIEIDDVEILEPLILKALGLGGGIIVEHGGLLHVAQLEAHALAVFQIDGRKQDHILSPEFT